MSDALEDQIIEQIGDLPPRDQMRVLDFARALSNSRSAGVSGKELLRFGGMFEAEDARRMSETIEVGCETIDPHEW